VQRSTGFGSTPVKVEIKTKLSGIYLHIPFCKQACTYCNFHFTTSLRYKQPLVQALMLELEQEREYLTDKVETIYFGGGTPSLLEVHEVESILKTIHRNYNVSSDAEITLEANPDDINRDVLRNWKNIGINRLSIGVQSFFEEELRWMNRAHNQQQAHEGLELAVSEFANITMDLIYGSPLLTDEKWKKNVDTALSLGVPHLSCYALTVEEKTPLHKQIQNAAKNNIDSDTQARQFLMLMEWLRNSGFEHYEVSNFAKPGFRSRHNSSYWKGLPYLGIGPSAHSFNGGERRWNLPNNNLYMQGMNSGQPFRERELLSTKDKLNEMIMISLRTREGLDLTRVEREFGLSERERLHLPLQEKVASGLVTLSDSNAQLTDEGMLQADGIAASLFV
jgi:oxygen-independent coproporphyrinogen III oxidase